MTTTIEYLEALKAKTGAASDYKLAQILGVTRAAVSLYRNKKSFFDDDVCLKAAQILDLQPFEVLINIHAERSTNQLVKNSFKDILQRVSGVAASVLFATALLANPAPAKAQSLIYSHNKCILCKIISAIKSHLRHLKFAPPISLGMMFAYSPRFFANQYN